MKCKFCGKEIEDGSVFCGYCGKKQPQVKNCVKCGHEIGLDDKWCGYCGAEQSSLDDDDNSVVKETETVAETQQENETASSPVDDAASNSVQPESTDDSEKPRQQDKPKSSKRKWLVVGIVALIVVAVCAIGYSTSGGKSQVADADSLATDSAMVEQDEAVDPLEGRLLGVWTYNCSARWERLCVLNKHGKGYFARILYPSPLEEEAGQRARIEEDESFKWRSDEGNLIIEIESGETQSYKLSDSGPLNDYPTNDFDGDDGDRSWIRANGVYANTSDGYTNIRRKPNTSSQVIGKLTNGGEPALSLGEENDWIKVQLHDITGYVEKSQVKVQ